MFMDDTAILATSRTSMQHKLTILIKTMNDIGMKIHPTKSKYIVINSPDNADFVQNNITIARVENYTYLGVKLSNKNITTQIEEDISDKTRHTMKYLSFLRKNPDAPFAIQKCVYESALQAGILYGCES